MGGLGFLLLLQSIVRVNSRDSTFSASSVILYLQIDQIEFVEELTVQQIPSSDVIVRRQLLSHQSGIDLVH